MKLKLVTFAGIISIVMIGLGLNSGWSSERIANEEAAGAYQSPVVLELYTSQGCSSCPPAEAVLHKIARDKKYGEALIPLAFHVDYWNYLGWIDPYSSPEWTNRQSDYLEKMSNAALYTPQLIVNGQFQMIGSDETQIKRSIEKIRSDTAPILYGVSIEKARFEGDRIKIDLKPFIADTTEYTPLMLVTAVFENANPTEVIKGENAGRTLANMYVVRAMDMQKFDSNVGLSKDVYQAELVPEPNWEVSNLGIAAWVQESGSLKIWGADVTRSVEITE